MKGHLKTCCATTLAALATIPISASALGFSAGHAYSTSENAINEYLSDGTLRSSASIGSNDLRGLAFGPDGYLYVVNAGDPFSSPASVSVLRADGGLVRSYAFTGLVWGNISYGKISFDSAGSTFYVGAANGLYKFDIGAASGMLHKNVEAFDAEALDDGGLLVASSYAIDRYGRDGSLLGSISTLDDPRGLTGDSNPWLVDVRGVEYDARSDTTFVTMLGYSGAVNMSFKVLALKGMTNEIVGIENYWYGDDLFVTDTGRLLVGSRTQAPGIFETDLRFVGHMSGPEARFVTALPVPEPGTWLMLTAGWAALTARARRARTQAPVRRHGGDRPALEMA